MSLQQRIERAWYAGSYWCWLGLPFMLLFWLLSTSRRYLYTLNILPSYAPKIPVIVVGNITVGGNGKTPIVLALAEYFQSKGFSVGVLSRGYTGSINAYPHHVNAADNAQRVGDEPWLIFQHITEHVVIDKNRVRGAKALEALGCTLIISDDGLQHYALQRTVEIVVMDKRQLGNGYLLPMGPLRETPARLKSVDHVILNGEFKTTNDIKTDHRMALSPVMFINVADNNKQLSIEAFVKKYPKVTAACAIGNPQRFFETLRSLGIILLNERAFNDHHHYKKGDMPDELMVVTEKDAVKLNAFASDDWWYLRVNASLPDLFFEHVNQQITNCS